MDTRSNRSASATTAESDSLTKFLDAVEALWPGSTRVARLIEQHDEWLAKKQTDGKSWYDIITSTLDENWVADDDDGLLWDTDAEAD
jgi:hypothetical protein